MVLLIVFICCCRKTVPKLSGSGGKLLLVMITWYSNWTKLNEDDLDMLIILAPGAGRKPMSLVHFSFISFPTDSLPALSRSIVCISLCVALSPKENRIGPKIYDLRTWRTQLPSVSFGCSQPYGHWDARVGPMGST